MFNFEISEINFEILEKKFEEYLNLANIYLSPFYLAQFEAMVSSDNLWFKHFLAVFGGIVFILFVKHFYPEEMRYAKKWRKYLKRKNHKLYACVDGTIRYLESFEFFIRKGFPFVVSYFLFFAAWLFNT